jgi:hypothetical protein
LLLVANGNQAATTTPYEEDTIHSDLISDPVENSSEEETTESLEESSEEAGSSEIIPQIIDDGLDSNTRRSTRTRNQPKPLTFTDFQAARNWQEMANNVSDMELLQLVRQKPRSHPSISMLQILLLLCLHLWVSDQS